MRIETLLSPGLLSQGLRLRTIAAQAISQIEITSTHYPSGLSGQATKLHAFFTDCASKIAALRDVTAPTVFTRTGSIANKTVTLTMSEGLDASVVPATSAFVFSPVKTISKIEVVGKTVKLTLTAAVANGDTVTYTQPGTNGLRDPGGNLVATTGALTITAA